MRCRYVRKKFQNEENGYTVAVYQTEDPSVPLAARDKYLEMCIRDSLQDS